MMLVKDIASSTSKLVLIWTKCYILISYEFYYIPCMCTFYFKVRSIWRVFQRRFLSEAMNVIFKLQLISKYLKFILIQSCYPLLFSGFLLHNLFALSYSACLCAAKLRYMRDQICENKSFSLFKVSIQF